jgi:hypothetical protein
MKGDHVDMAYSLKWNQLVSALLGSDRWGLSGLQFSLPLQKICVEINIMRCFVSPSSLACGPYSSAVSPSG